MQRAKWQDPCRRSTEALKARMTLSTSLRSRRARETQGSVGKIVDVTQPQSDRPEPGRTRQVHVRWKQQHHQNTHRSTQGANRRRCAESDANERAVWRSRLSEPMANAREQRLRASEALSGRSRTDRISCSCVSGLVSVSCSASPAASEAANAFALKPALDRPSRPHAPPTVRALLDFGARLRLARRARRLISRNAAQSERQRPAGQVRSLALSLQLISQRRCLHRARRGLRRGLEPAPGEPAAVRRSDGSSAR